MTRQQDNDVYTIIDKTYLHIKDPYEVKCQHLIEKRENNALKNLKDLKAFIEY